jgi:hypothetical protein
LPEAIEHFVYRIGSGSEPSLTSLDREIRELVRASRMPSPYIELDYQTEPSFLQALPVYGHHHDMILVRPPGFASLAGLGIRSLRRAWLGGKVVDIGYLHHLRFMPQIRGGPYLLRGYRALRRACSQTPVPLTITSILEDNQAAREVLENQRGGGIMPSYKAVSRFLTALIPLRGPGTRWPQRYRSSAAGTENIRRLASADIPQLLDLFAEFGSCYEAAPAFAHEDFSSSAGCSLTGLDITSMLGVFENSRLMAAIGLWNQQNYKQIIVSQLCKPLLLARGIWQAGRSLWGNCPVPAMGERVDSVLLDPWAVRPGCESRLMPLLVRAAAAEAKRSGAVFAAFGVAEKNPAINAVNSVFFLPYWSIIYQVFWPETSAYQFDGRHLQLANLGAL